MRASWPAWSAALVAAHAPDDESAPEPMRGVGIRIEDDVLVTADGHEVLTAAIPKTIDEVEALTAA
jgi:Xaa-Pro aminopeptidase